MVLCVYCNKEMILKRFVDKNYDGEIVNERFLFVCDKCKVMISPKLVCIDSYESESEKKLLRNLYFAQVNNSKDKDK